MATPAFVTLANANQYSQTGSANPVGSFSSITDVSPGGSTLGQAFQTSPAQLFPGQMWRFSANGIWSNTSSVGLSLGIYYGGAAGSPLCYGSVGAGSAWTVAASVPWSLNALGRVVSVGTGTSSTWQIIGTLVGINQNGLTTMMPNNGTGFDSSITKVITLASTMTASAAGNALTVYNWAIEYMTEP